MWEDLEHSDPSPFLRLGNLQSFISQPPLLYFLAYLAIIHGVETVTVHTLVTKDDGIRVYNSLQRLKDADKPLAR